jgi:hypothetical protein
MSRLDNTGEETRDKKRDDATGKNKDAIKLGKLQHVDQVGEPQRLKVIAASVE